MSNFETITHACEIGEALAVMVTGVVGLGWFLKRKEYKPRIDLDHTIHHQLLSNGNILVTVELLIYNRGQLPRKISTAYTQLQGGIPDDLTTDVNSNGYRIYPRNCSARGKTYASSVLQVEPGCVERIPFEFQITSAPLGQTFYAVSEIKAVEYGVDAVWKKETFYEAK